MSSYFSPYELRSLQDLNAKTKAGVRKGALLKIEFPGSLVGYADLHPWPELGDANLEDCLSGKLEPFSRSVELARMDGEARSRGQFLQARSLKSHRLLRDLDFDPSVVDDDMIFKIKMGANLPVETVKLHSFVKRLRGIQKVRIDLNLCLKPEAFDEWLDQNSSWLLGRLDFVEDPCAYQQDIFERWQTAIAFDRLAIPQGFVAAVKVVKPVREDVEGSECFHNYRPKRIVFTHNMDHPLGQRAARSCASQFYDKYPEFLEPGGLESFDGYHLKDQSLIHPQETETGFGFDNYLSALAWTPL